MLLTLSEFRRRSCHRLLEKLMSIKSRMSLDEFRNALEDTHKAFLVVVNSFAIENSPRLECRETERERRIVRVAVGQLVLSVVDGTVVDIDQKYPELARLFVNRSLEMAMDLASALWDYDTRCCDLCGLYFLKPHFETPTGRSKKEDFYLAYHEGCTEGDGQPYGNLL